MKKIRKISCNELMYYDSEKLTNQYTIQLIFEIKKIKHISKINEAINKVIKNNIGSNVFLKGNNYYLNDNKVKIEKVTVDTDDIYNMDFFREIIDIEKSSLKLYILYNKKDNRQYLVFKSSHSVMDGKGALLFITNLVNYLNNDDLIKCSNSITDYQFVKKLNYYKKTESKYPYLKNPYTKKINNYKTKIRIISIDGYIQAIVAKLSCILADEFNNNEMRVMIPTDIRRYDKENNYIGNLTLPVFVNVDKGDDYKIVNGKMLYSLKENKELNLKNTSYLGYQYLPKIIRKLFLKVGLKYISNSNKFSAGALISFLGRINVDDLQNDYFNVNDLVSLPAHNPLILYSFVITEFANKTNIAFIYYEKQFDEKYVDYIENKIKNNLKNGD